MLLFCLWELSGTEMKEFVLRLVEHSKQTPLVPPFAEQEVPNEIEPWHAVICQSTDMNSDNGHKRTAVSCVDKIGFVPVRFPKEDCWSGEDLDTGVGSHSQSGSVAEERNRRENQQRTNLASEGVGDVLGGPSTKKSPLRTIVLNQQYSQCNFIFVLVASVALIFSSSFFLLFFSSVAFPWSTGFCGGLSVGTDRSRFRRRRVLSVVGGKSSLKKDFLSPHESSWTPVQGGGEGWRPWRRIPPQRRGGRYYHSTPGMSWISHIYPGPSFSPDWGSQWDGLVVRKCLLVGEWWCRREEGYHNNVTLLWLISHVDRNGEDGKNLFMIDKPNTPTMTQM